MRINDENLKEIYKSYILARIPLSRHACPASEEISDIFASPGSGKNEEKIIDHITNCSYCVQEFDAFLEISRGEKKLVEEIDMLLKRGIFGRSTLRKKSKRKKPFLLSWKFALATALTVVFALAIFLIKAGPLLDKRAEKRSSRPGIVELIEPHVDLPASRPLVFKWEDIKGRDYFILEIFDESLFLLWKSAKIYENTFQLPPEVENKMVRGQLCFWMITAFLPNGVAIESHLEEFLIPE